MRKYKYILLTVFLLALIFSGCSNQNNKTLIAREQCEAKSGYNVEVGKIYYMAICHLDDGCAPLGCSDPYCVCSPKIVLSDADIESFEIFGLHYAKDKNHVYRDGKIVDYMDAQTFEYLDITYSKDKNYVYKNGKEFNIADPETFELIPEIYAAAKDKNNFYQFGEIIRNVDESSFEVLDNKLYANNHDIIYHRGKEIRGVDIATFEILDSTYSKDKNHIYRDNVIFEEADPETFEIVSSGSYTKDKNNVYYLGKIIEGADPKTFDFSGK